MCVCVSVCCVCVCVWCVRGSLGLPGASSWCLLWLSVFGLLCVLMFIVGVALVAAIAQLGERQTEDLKVPGSIPGLGIFHTGMCGLFCKDAPVP